MRRQSSWMLGRSRHSGASERARTAVRAILAKLKRAYFATTRETWETWSRSRYHRSSESSSFCALLVRHRAARTTTVPAGCSSASGSQRSTSLADRRRSYAEHNAWGDQYIRIRASQPHTGRLTPGQLESTPGTRCYGWGTPRSLDPAVRPDGGSTKPRDPGTPPSRPAPLVRIDPGVLVRNDPPLSGVVFGDGGRRREEETSLLEVSALVSA